MSENKMKFVAVEEVQGAPKYTPFAIAFRAAAMYLPYSCIEWAQKNPQHLSHMTETAKFNGPWSPITAGGPEGGTLYWFDKGQLEDILKKPDIETHQTPWQKSEIEKALQAFTI